MVDDFKPPPFRMCFVAAIFYICRTDVAGARITFTAALAVVRAGTAAIMIITVTRRTLRNTGAVSFRTAVLRNPAAACGIELAIEVGNIGFTS